MKNFLLLSLFLAVANLEAQILPDIESFDGAILRSVPALKKAAQKELRFASLVAGFEQFSVSENRAIGGPMFIISGSACQISIFCGRNKARDEWIETDYSTLKRVGDFYVVIETDETENIYWRDRHGNGYFIIYNEFGPIIFNGDSYSLMNENEVKALKENVANILKIIRNGT
ncbi:MAG: hypothetical protein WC441_03750 [Patescibacteria group bacterium]